MVPSNSFGYVGGGFADEFDIAHGSVVAHGIGGEFCSACSLCERENPSTRSTLSLTLKRHSRWDVASDMHSFARYVRANFSSKCLLRDQINGAPEQILKVKQNTKILCR